MRGGARRTGWNLAWIACTALAIACSGGSNVSGDAGDGSPEADALDGGEVGATDGGDPSDGSDGIDDSDDAVCGDGECTDDETVLTCRPDCVAPPALICLAQSCESSLDACLDLPGCFDALDCVLACEGSATTCVESCAAGLVGADEFVMNQLLACSDDAECLDTEPPPDPASCEGRCDEVAEEGVCQCDTDCGFFGDCCDDYEAVCVDGPACGDGVCQPNEGPQTCPQDCPVGPVCGDGVCQPSEGPQVCPQDCPVGPVCGDGVCQPSEGPQICPEDCEGPGGLIACLEDNCAAQLDACLDVAPCAQALPCLAECVADGQTGCTQACSGPGGAQGALLALGQCGGQAGCGNPGPGGCGNGICQQGETAQNCPQDCEGPGGFCGDGDCSDDEGCQACPQDCGPCVPGGDCCEPSQTPGCGDAELEQCVCDQDAFCCQNGWDDLCVQLATVCGGCEGGPGPVCGDGICQAGESANTCPQDCEGGPVGCLEQACGQEADGCASDATCSALFECWVECMSEGGGGCGQQCVQEIGFTPAFPDLLQCGQAAGCFDGGGPGGCGDGQCGQGEGCEDCPEDCGPCQPGGGDCCEVTEGPGCTDAALEACVCAQDAFCCDTSWDDVCIQVAQQCGGCGGGPGPVCGDGICQPGEDAETCPQDCEGGGPADCLQDACGEEATACAGDGTCSALFECWVECVTVGGSGCGQQCVQEIGFSPAFPDLLQCGQAAGCFDGGGPGGCGDDQCGQGEDCESCPQDCGPCQPGGGDCCEATAGPGCADAEIEACVCSQDAFCCDTSWDDVCIQGAQACGACGGGPGAVCGDGICQADESADTCPEDCDGPGGGLLQCLDEGCTTELSDCLDDPACAQTLPCLEACVADGGTGCTTSCAGPGGPTGALLALGQCGAAAGCGNPAPGEFCGDGECSAAESPQSCPQDCAGGGGFCGDGVCNGPENAQTCPQDCGGGGSSALLQCLEDACADALAACQAAPTCAAAVACLEECVDAGQTGCTQTCIQQVGFTQELLQLGQCGGAAGCGNPG